MAQASVQEASLVPPWRDPGADLRWRDYVSWLKGTPSDAPGRLGGNGWGEGGLGFPVKDTVPLTRTQISGRPQGTRYGVVSEEKHRQQLHMCFCRWSLKTVWMTDETLLDGNLTEFHMQSRY